MDGRWAPILLLTARDSVDDRVIGLDAGADDYIPKPFSFEELYARQRALTRRGAPEPPRVLEVGDLELDPARHRATRAGKEIELSPKEFALLDLFMRHADEVLSRTTILEHVWDFVYDGTSNVVDVYVRYVREKIDRPFDRTTLETVRGVGYRLRTRVIRRPRTLRGRLTLVFALVTAVLCLLVGVMVDFQYRNALRDALDDGLVTRFDNLDATSPRAAISPSNLRCRMPRRSRRSSMWTARS